MENFERLGVFYLGRRYDLRTRKRADELVLCDSMKQAGDVGRAQETVGAVQQQIPPG